MKKSRKGWAVVSINGVIMLETVSDTRASSIDEFMRCRPQESWDEWRKKGVQCMKIEVRSIEKSEGDK